MIKKIYFGYLHGLYKLLEKGNEPDIIVLTLMMVAYGFILIICSIIFNFDLPKRHFFKNNLANNILGGVVCGLITKYIFQVRFTIYSKYEPMPKKLTLTITIVFFSVFILLLIFMDYIPFTM